MYKRQVVQNPPQKPLSQEEMDEVYALPYMRTYHPSYEEAGGVPAISAVSYTHLDVYKRQMKSKAKDEVMQRFANNESQVLVSTTVVEVGVNVPNATVMMIENAEDVYKRQTISLIPCVTICFSTRMCL